MMWTGAFYRGKDCTRKGEGVGKGVVVDPVVIVGVVIIVV